MRLIEYNQLSIAAIIRNIVATTSVDNAGQLEMALVRWDTLNRHVHADPFARLLVKAMQDGILQNGA